MPSDAKKKQQQKKKEAAKARQSGKKPSQSNNQTKIADDNKDQNPTLGDLQNGTNGTAISAEGRCKIMLFFISSLENINELSYSSHFLVIFDV